MSKTRVTDVSKISYCSKCIVCLYPVSNLFEIIFQKIDSKVQFEEPDPDEVEMDAEDQEVEEGPKDKKLRLSVSTESLQQSVADEEEEETIVVQEEAPLPPPAGLDTNSFFLFPFCEKSLICLQGKSMTPHRGNTFLFRSSQQLPRLRLGPSKGFLS